MGCSPGAIHVILNAVKDLARSSARSGNEPQLLLYIMSSKPGVLYIGSTND